MREVPADLCALGVVYLVPLRQDPVCTVDTELLMPPPNVPVRRFLFHGLVRDYATGVCMATFMEE
jgi:hypothetical protein